MRTARTRMTLTLPVNRTPSADVTYVDDGTFEPYTQVSAVLTAGASTQCVFDGYVLSWRLHLDRASTEVDDPGLGSGCLLADEHR